MKALGWEWNLSEDRLIYVYIHIPTYCLLFEKFIYS